MLHTVRINSMRPIITSLTSRHRCCWPVPLREIARSLVKTVPSEYRAA